MKTTSLLILAVLFLCGFTYGYKDNVWTGKKDMVVTSVNNTSDIKASIAFANVSAAQRLGTGITPFGLATKTLVGCNTNSGARLQVCVSDGDGIRTTNRTTTGGSGSYFYFSNLNDSVTIIDIARIRSYLTSSTPGYESADMWLETYNSGMWYANIKLSHDGTVSIGGTNIVYYCNAGTNIGLLTINNTGPCPGGVWVATALKL